MSASNLDAPESNETGAPGAESVADEGELEEVLSSELPSEARVGGVIIEDCAKVSKFLQLFMESYEGETLGLGGNDWNLEVSSPGINRALRRTEHFKGAIGERVRVRFNRSESVLVETIDAPPKGTHLPPVALLGKKVSRSPSKRGSRPSAESLAKEAEKISKKGIISGTLRSYDSSLIVVEDDRGVLRASIPLDLVREARVDFLFG